VITPEGKVKFIKDWHYLLTDTTDNIVGIAGLAQDIPQAQWEAQLENAKERKNVDPKELLQQHVFNILQNELHLQAQGVKGSSSPQNNAQPVIVLDNNKMPVTLSRREIEVVLYLRQGMTAKQTANKMHVSTRTVEFHLDNIKDKAGCRTKLELLSRIQD
jgi:DNA-binding NarL/FixJ family response regulator